MKTKIILFVIVSTIFVGCDSINDNEPEKEDNKTNLNISEEFVKVIREYDSYVKSIYLNSDNKYYKTLKKCPIQCTFYQDDKDTFLLIKKAEYKTEFEDTIYSWQYKTKINESVILIADKKESSLGTDFYDKLKLEQLTPSEYNYPKEGLWYHDVEFKNRFWYYKLNNGKLILIRKE